MHSDVLACINPCGDDVTMTAPFPSDDPQSFAANNAGERSFAFRRRMYKSDDFIETSRLSLKYDRSVHRLKHRTDFTVALIGY